MAIIQLLLAIIILGVIYKKALKWNVSGDISKKQAYIPIAFGVLSTIFSFLLVFAIAYLLITIGYTKDNIDNPVIRALFSAFFMAGFTEEIAKLLMILLSIKLFRPANVYEYALIGGAVGIGFTLHEELLYGGSLVGLSRLLTVLIHMSLGIIMGKYIGIGKYNKENGLPYKSQYALGIIVPIAIHTVYDALTAANPALKNPEGMSDDVMTVWILVALIGVLCAAVWQIVIVRSLKKNAQKYCSMNFNL